ncbi:hypothetical protein C6P44_002204 [Monosporozyma unispora]|nr:hypothetical protein C6P44_002204 [Kazachstania unispora]
MKFSYLTITIFSVFLKISFCKTDGTLNGDVLLTASDTESIVGVSTSINEDYLGTFLLHLPSAIKSTYTSYLSQKAQPTVTNISKNKEAEAVRTTSIKSKDVQTTEIKKPANVTSSEVSLFKPSTKPSSATSILKMKTSVGFASTMTIPYHTLLLLLSLIFF